MWVGLGFSAEKKVPIVQDPDYLHYCHPGRLLHLPVPWARAMLVHAFLHSSEWQSLSMLCNPVLHFALAVLQCVGTPYLNAAELSHGQKATGFQGTAMVLLPRFHILPVWK
eukprot:145748-Pelagomonas_calceolata.AAC.1